MIEVLVIFHHGHSIYKIFAHYAHSFMASISESDMVHVLQGVPYDISTSLQVNNNESCVVRSQAILLFGCI